MARRLLSEITARSQDASMVVTDEAAIAASSSTLGNLSSNARTTAMTLRAFVAADPKNPLVPKLVRGLLSLRRNGRWQNTQASAWALSALDDARPLFSPMGRSPSAATLAIDGIIVGRAAFTNKSGGEAVTGAVPITKLLAAPGGAMTFTTSDENHPLYYEGVLRFARLEPPKTSLDRGLHIARSLRVLGKKGVIEAKPTFEVGDYAVVEIVVGTSVARDLVVVDDPIPAGFEPVNMSFANVDRRPALIEDPARDLITHRELRDDRVVSFFDQLPVGATLTRYLVRATSAGHFAAPPAKAECMYAPDVFGRTATTWVDVTN